MSFRIVFTKPIYGKTEVQVTTLNIVDGMIIKGNFRTPITNVEYIEEI